MMLLEPKREHVVNQIAPHPATSDLRRNNNVTD